MRFAEAIGQAFANEYAFGSKIFFKGTDSDICSPAPHYIDFILRGLKRGMQRKRLTCIVFPKKGIAAYAAWVVQAAESLASEVLPKRIAEHTARQLGDLRVGDLVKTYPGDKVFVWAGETTDSMNRKYIAFKVIGSNSTNNQDAEIFSPLRVRKYPGQNPPPRQRGKLGDLRSIPQASGLDLLMPVKCYDNRDLVRACACLVAYPSDVTEFISSVQLSRSELGPFVSLKESLVVKSVEDIEPVRCGCLHAGDLNSAYETLCSRTDFPLGEQTPLILDGLKHVRDYEQIHALRFDREGRQRPIVVVADYTERTHIERLADAFDYWEVHHCEIEG
jgi:hypothetical protein